MKKISNLSELEQLYGAASSKSIDKVVRAMTPLYKTWIEASRFLVLASLGPGGSDCSPRGDIGPVVRIADENTIYLPDWRGNNRLDSLRNIVDNGIVSLMFMVPGCDNVVRVNGTAFLTADKALCDTFAKNDRRPKTVIVVTIREMYFQCAKALMRSGLWSGQNHVDNLPTAGDFIREFSEGFDAASYDADYPEYAKGRMW